MLIWWIADVCSCEAGGDLADQVEVSRIIGTISPSRWPAFSATATLAAGQLADLVGGRLAPLGELADLAGHHGEPLALRAGPGGLDRGVQGQEVRLVGDVLDDLDLLRDLAHGGDGLLDGLAALLRADAQAWLAACAVSLALLRVDA